MPGVHLEPHVDAPRRDATGGCFSSTHTVVIFLTDCAAGGETLLLERLPPPHGGGDLVGMSVSETGIDEARLGVLAAVKPVRGRILIFPHACPHAARRPINLPRLLLRGE